MKAVSKIPRQIEIKIKAVYSSLKPAEKRAADFFTEEPEKVKSMTITNLAKSAGCSEATICRFAKKLGYDTYSEMKDDLINTELTPSVGITSSYKEEDTAGDILKKTVDICIQALQDTYCSVDVAQLEGAANALEKAEFIVCVGTGDAETVVLSLFNKLTRIGRRVSYTSDTDMMHILTAQLKKNDVIVCVSHSGRTRNIANIARLAKNKGAKVIAITNYPMSQLAKRADYALFTASFTESLVGEVISKRIAELCIVESLFITLVRRNNKYLEAMQRSNDSVIVNKY